MSVVFVDELPPRMKGKPPARYAERYAEFFTAIDARPMRWALLRKAASARAARICVYLLRKEFPAGFEFEHRNGEVYARRVRS